MSKILNFAKNTLIMIVVTQFIVFASAIDGLAEGKNTLLGIVLSGGILLAIMFALFMLIPFVVGLSMDAISFFAKRRASRLLPAYRKNSLKVAEIADEISDIASSIFIHVLRYMCS